MPKQAAESTPTPSPAPVPSVNKPAGKKGGKSGMVIIALIIIVALFAWVEMGRRNATKELAATRAQLEEIQAGTQDNGEEIANQVLEKVHALIDIPTDPRPTVATINDVERLRSANSFFNNAENGDFLILTGNRAILFDLDRNIIIDVAPFRINATSPTPAAGSAVDEE